MIKLDALLTIGIPSGGDWCADTALSIIGLITGTIGSGANIPIAINNVRGADLPKQMTEIVYAGIRWARRQPCRPTRGRHTMSLSAEAFDALRDHWAVSAAGAEALERANRLVNERLATRAVGKQITFSFAVDSEDEPFLERIALAYEMAAIEGLDELSRPSGENRALRDQAVAASFKAFDIRRLMPVPMETSDRLLFVMQLSAMAYCGDRWSDLMRWYKDNEPALSAPSVAEVPWDRRLLYRLFHCWVRLFRKNGWDDLDRIREIIAGLRDDQKRLEAERLNNGSQAADRAIALRLAALYHWAKATEILAHYMLQGEPLSPFAGLDKHFDAALKAAIASGDAQHEVVLRWLHATARVMVTNSLWWATRTVNSRTSEFVQI